MGLEFVVALSIVGTLFAPRIDATSQKNQPTHPAAQAALRYFESVQGEDVDAVLRQLRRPAPSATVRAIVIRNLPEEGELSPTRQEAAKLAFIRPILAFHEREHDMEVRLITVGGLAFVGLHARTVLLISREALGLFNTDELQTIMRMNSATITSGKSIARLESKATTAGCRNWNCGVTALPSSR